VPSGEVIGPQQHRRVLDGVVDQGGACGVGGNQKNTSILPVRPFCKGYKKQLRVERVRQTHKESHAFPPPPVTTSVMSAPRMRASHPSTNLPWRLKNSPSIPLEPVSAFRQAAEKPGLTSPKRRGRATWRSCAATGRGGGKPAPRMDQPGGPGADQFGGRIPKARVYFEAGPAAGARRTRLPYHLEEISGDP